MTPNETRTAIAVSAARAAAENLGAERLRGVAIGSDADYVLREIEEAVRDFDAANQGSRR